MTAVEMFIDSCPYSETGWGWWERDSDGKRCTCRPAKAALATIRSRAKRDTGVRHARGFGPGDGDSRIQTQQASGDTVSLIEELVARLNDARSAIASLDTWALGEAENGGGTVWPIRDELLHYIDQTLTKARGEQPGGLDV